MLGQRSFLCDEVEQILTLRWSLQNQQEAPPLHLEPVQHADDTPVTPDLRQPLQQSDLHGNGADLTGLRGERDYKQEPTSSLQYLLIYM